MKLRKWIIVCPDEALAVKASLSPSGSLAVGVNA